MIRPSIILFLFLFVLVCPIYGQHQEEIPINVKFALFPLFPKVFSNDYYVGLQHEKAFASNSKFTRMATLLYNDYFFRTYFGSQLVSSIRHLSIYFKYGGRYYIGKSDDPYNGFFVGLSPFYNWQHLSGGTLKRHNFGLDAMIGYQRTIKKISLEANTSFGYSRGWYRYTYVPLYEDQQGYKNLTILWVQINIGYKLSQIFSGSPTTSP